MIAQWKQKRGRVTLYSIRSVKMWVKNFTRMSQLTWLLQSKWCKANQLDKLAWEHKELAWKNSPKKVHSGIRASRRWIQAELGVEWWHVKRWGRVRAGRGIGSTAHIRTILGTDTCGTGGTEDRKRAGGKGGKDPCMFKRKLYSWTQSLRTANKWGENTFFGC